MPDRWECPDCGWGIEDPPAPLYKCTCGSRNIRIVEWPENEEVQFRDDPAPMEDNNDG